jgi:hypothetical protein
LNISEKKCGHLKTPSQKPYLIKNIYDRKFGKYEKRVTNKKFIYETISSNHHLNVVNSKIYTHVTYTNE